MMMYLKKKAYLLSIITGGMTVLRIPQTFLSVPSIHILNLLPESPLITDRKRKGFHGDPILVEKGPFCNNVSRSASSLKLCLQDRRK